MSADLMKWKFGRRPSVVRPSFVCGIDYLWSYCMDFFQILVLAPSVPYLFFNFSFFFLIFFVFVNMGPYGRGNFKNATPISNHFWIFSNFFCIFFLVVLIKILFSIFEMLSFQFLTNFWNSPLFPMGKPKPGVYSVYWFLTMAGRRAKLSESWYWGLSIQRIQGTFDS